MFSRTLDLIEGNLSGRGSSLHRRPRATSISTLKGELLESMAQRLTGDSIHKFEKSRCALEYSMRRVEDIVPQSIGCQISEILGEVQLINLSLDPEEKHVGDETISLLQQGRKLDNDCCDNNEVESFQHVASKPTITSLRLTLRERRDL